MIRFNQTDLLGRGGSHWRRRRRYRISIHPSISSSSFLQRRSQPDIFSPRATSIISKPTQTQLVHTHIDPPFGGCPACQYNFLYSPSRSPGSNTRVASLRHLSLFHYFCFDRYRERYIRSIDCIV